MEQLLLLGGRLLVREACVGTGSEFVLEFFNPSCGIDELEFARVERMTNVTNVDLQLFPRATGGKTVATTAGHLGFEIVWMNAVFHDRFPPGW